MPSDPRSNAPPVWLALPIGALVLAIIGWMVVESNIEVLSDERNVYVHNLPAKRGAAVRYRIANDAYQTAPWDETRTFVTVPLDAARRPERGVVPIDLEYRTWIGVTRTKRISFDVDEEQIRHFHASLGSSGVRQTFSFVNTRLRIGLENERCVRWVYSLDAETAEHEIPEHSEYVEIGHAKLVKVKTKLCHRIQQCTFLMKREEGMPYLVDDSCL